MCSTNRTLPLLPARAANGVDMVGAWAVNSVYCTDALTMLAGLPDASVNLITVDWPYNGVKDEEWDNQWATDSDYLAWMKTHLLEMRRVLTPNGSYYGFASPRMAARVEVLTGDVFNVINRITWRKPPYSTKAEMFDKDMMRGYFPASEAVVFAEQYSGDRLYQGALIDGNSNYWEALEGAKVSIIGDYLRQEFTRAKVTNRQIAQLFPSATGGLTGCVSNWLLGYNIPTPEQYSKMRAFLNDTGGDYLRREYEDLRRPFNVSADVPYTDVWDFPTVGTYAGKHPCEKPLTMMQHIVSASSRPGDIVLDCFCGSGNSMVAAKTLGRRYIGCDRDSHWVQVSTNKLVTEFGQRRKTHKPIDDLPLFAKLAG